jgi:hypothetical protein
MEEKIILCCGSGRWLKFISVLKIAEYLTSILVFSYELKRTVGEIKGNKARHRPDYDLMFFTLVVAYSSLNLVYSVVLLVGSAKKITGLLKAWIIWCVVGLLFGTCLVIIRATCLDLSYITPIIVDMFLDLGVLWLAYQRLNEILAVRLRSDMLLNEACPNR